MNKEVILSIKNLSVSFKSHGKDVHVIRGITLDVFKGETLGIVGESGSGKSVFTKTFMGMLDANGKIKQGTLTLNGISLLKDREEKEFAKFQLKREAINDRITGKVFEYKIGNQLIKKEKSEQKCVILVARESSETNNQVRNIEGNIQALERKFAKESSALSDEAKKGVKAVVLKRKIARLQRKTERLNEDLIYFTEKANEKKNKQFAKIETKIVILKEKQATAIKNTEVSNKKYLPHFNSIDRREKRYISRCEKRVAQIKRDEELIKVRLKPNEKGLVSFKWRVFYFFKSFITKIKAKSSLATISKLSNSGIITDDVVHLEKLKNNQEWSLVRGKHIGTIFQDPMTSLNPLLTIGSQISEVLRLHHHLSAHKAKVEAINLLKKVKIPHAEERYDDYPFQYSGGMRQRVVIAIALACRPDILVCDEPTTALDVTVQSQILRLIKELQIEFGFTTIFITHDLGVVAGIADRIVVMYGGEIIEYGTADEIFYEPAHPYTWALLSSLPQLATDGEPLTYIKGNPPTFVQEIQGDAFAPRNDYALKIDSIIEPPMFKITETHHAKTWLLDPRAPKVEKPLIIRNLSTKMAKFAAQLKSGGDVK